MRILIADDDPALRVLLRLQLEGDDHTVVDVVDGDEALREVEHDRPDVLVLDVMMPGLDGWAVLERLRRDPATRALPVVLLSARDVPDDVRRGYAAGASSVLSKARAHELVETVAGLTRGHHVRMTTAESHNS